MKRIYVLLTALMFAVVCGCSSEQKKQDTTYPAMQTASKTDQKSASSHSTGSSLECTRANDVRKIEIQSKDAGCDVMYTKFGHTKSVASDAAGNAYCEKTLAHMKQKLEAAGFQCQ